MLLKTTVELKKFFSNIQSDYNFKSIQSFIIDAEAEFIIPAIGRAMYDQFELEYNNTGPNYSGKFKTAHEIAQKAITHLALYFSADSGSFHISDSGFYVTVGTDNKPVSDKKMVTFREGRMASGLKAVDELIDYLEQNLDDPLFLAYKNSNERQAYSKYIIQNARAFTNHFSPLKNSSLTFRMMLSSMDQVEDRYIRPLLGDELFDDLKREQTNVDLKASYNKLRTYLQKTIALLTIAEAIPILQFNYDGSALAYSLRVANNENIETTQTLNEERLSNLMNSCLQNGRAQLERTKSFLLKYAVNYPLYQAPAVIENRKPNDDSYGFYLV